MEREKIIEMAGQNYISLKNIENWNSYAIEYDLPSYEEVTSIFASWKAFRKIVFLSIAQKHKKFFYTPKNWDKHAKNNNLPEAKHYRAIFGEWKKAQAEVFEGIDMNELKKQYLLTIAKENIKHLNTQKEWDEFASKQGLPVSATFRNHFGKWDTVVRNVTGKEIINRYTRYTKESLIPILNKHKEYLITQETWKKHAQENQLPSVNTIAKHFGTFNEAKYSLSITKIQKREFSKDELWGIAQKHKEMFHFSLWNFYATTNHLPTETAFINHFGHFKNVQDELGIVEGDFSEKTKEVMAATVQKKKNILNELIKKNKQVVEQIYTSWHLLESKDKWEQFAETLAGYPTYYELLSLFSTKRQLKQVLFFYIAEKYKEIFNRVEWNNFATANKLPSKKNYSDLFSSWVLVQRMVWGDSKESERVYLLRIALEHIDNFTTCSNWKEYSRLHYLPSTRKYELYFGSWNNVKKALGLKVNEPRNYLLK